MILLFYFWSPYKIIWHSIFVWLLVHRPLFLLILAFEADLMMNFVNYPVDVFILFLFFLFYLLFLYLNHLGRHNILGYVRFVLLYILAVILNDLVLPLLPLASTISLYIQEVTQDLQVATELDVLALGKAWLCQRTLSSLEVIGVASLECRVLGDEALDGLHRLPIFKAYV